MNFVQIHLPLLITRNFGGAIFTIQWAEIYEMAICFELCLYIWEYINKASLNGNILVKYLYKLRNTMTITGQVTRESLIVTCASMNPIILIQNYSSIFVGQYGCTPVEIEDVQVNANLR